MNDARHMYQIDNVQSVLDGIFELLKTYVPSWNFLQAEDTREIATMYFAHSSRKRLSMLTRGYLTPAMTQTAFVSVIARTLANRYGANWDSVFKAYFETEYNPLDNYAMKEVELPNLTDTTDINTKTKLVNTQKSDVYGFNSQSLVGEHETEVTTEGDKDKNETTSKTTRKGVRTLERKGNIGVTSSQQLLQSEIDVRKFDYWQSVFGDIDRALCVMVWSC